MSNPSSPFILEQFLSFEKPEAGYESLFRPSRQAKRAISILFIIGNIKQMYLDRLDPHTHFRAKKFLFMWLFQTAWLLKEMNVDFLEWNEFDDPNSISNSIMSELKKLGFKVAASGWLHVRMMREVSFLIMPNNSNNVNCNF